MLLSWSTGISGAGLTPAQIAHAYEFDKIHFENGGAVVAGDGRGQTIAIVDAYDAPNVASDLKAFDAQFGLPDPPSFVKVGQTGSVSSLPAPAQLNTYGIETTMDVEWAHALAPAANIVLVEANDEYNLPAATATAADWPGVCAVSLSYAAPENQAASPLGWYPNFGQIFSQHPQVTFVVSSGDQHNGEIVDYPSTDPNALAVGGTEFYATSAPVIDAAGDYVHEEVWNEGVGNASGGGPSSLFAAPAWQSAVTGTTQHRVTPDVSFHGYGSCYMYDSYDSPAAPWSDDGGGTSVSAPSWAALVAIADQGWIEHGSNVTLGNSVMPLLYAIGGNSTYYSAAFHDITVGDNNYYSAGTGFDMATGLGTPHAEIIAEWLGQNVPAPVPSSPADGSTVNTLTPTLSWSPVDGATGYSVTLTDTTTGNQIYSGTTAQTSYSVTTALTPGDNYAWSVASGLPRLAASGVTYSTPATAHFQIQNSPSVQNVQAASPQSGVVLISYTLYTPPGVAQASYSITPTYSIGGTSHSATSASSGDGVTSLAASSTGTPHTFAWNSSTDVGSMNFSVTFTIAINGASGSASAGSASLQVVNSADTTPPSISAFSAPSPTNGATETITVTYADDSAVSVSTLGNGNLLVTGPSGYSQLATYVGVDQNGDGSPRTATYSIGAPGGTWDPPDNGTYTIAVLANQVADTSGNYLPATTVGTFSVQILDTAPPTVSVFAAANITTFGRATEMITVTYADNYGLDVSTLGNGNLLVTGPNGFNRSASLASVDNNTNGTPRTVTYQVSPPGATWDATDNGVYNVAIQAGQVADTSGNFLIASALGSFTVALPSTTIGLYDPAGAHCYLKNSNTNSGSDVIDFAFGRDTSNWETIVGDWAGNGQETVGQYDPTSGQFYLPSDNSAAPASTNIFGFAVPSSWIPIAGDWSGTGRDTIGLYNPLGAHFYLASDNSSAPAKVISFGFESSNLPTTWVPVAGDWDGDGKDTVGLYDPANAHFYLINQNSSMPGAVISFGYEGLPQPVPWTPLVGDWTGTGHDTIGLYDPANTHFYLAGENSSTPASVISVGFENDRVPTSWRPLVGHWAGFASPSPAGTASSAAASPTAATLPAATMALVSNSGPTSARIAATETGSQEISDPYPGRIARVAVIDHIFDGFTKRPVASSPAPETMWLSDIDPLSAATKKTKELAGETSMLDFAFADSLPDDLRR